MADLSAVVGYKYGRSPLMPPVSALVANIQPGERFKISESPSLAMTLLALLAQEAVRVVANTVTGIRGNTGQVAFNASPDQATVTSYTARVRVSGSSTVTATQSLGVPTPDGNNVIVVDLSATFAGLAAGNYTVSILTTTAGGSTDSTESTAFALPLS